MDLIDRWQAIDALQKEINKAKPPFDDVVGSIRCGVRLARNIIEDLPSAQPYTAEEIQKMQELEFAQVEKAYELGRESAQQEKQHGRIFQEIVVEYPSYNTYPEYKGKPYFSIKYTENGQEFIGYGTYKPEVLSEYLKEYFMPSVQPERKKGKWIDRNGNIVAPFWERYECPECGARSGNTNYCPNCGAHMKGGTT